MSMEHQIRNPIFTGHTIPSMWSTKNIKKKVVKPVFPSPVINLPPRVY